MISANSVLKVNQNNWQKEEKKWYNKFPLVCSVNKQVSAKTGGRNKGWKLRGSQNEIEKWIQNQKTYTLHFDGASKNNPGKAGAGGIILDQEGKVISTYEWGLGNMTNNKAEAYNLFLGTCILKNLQAKDLVIIGDSVIIIDAMETGGDFKNQSLNRIKQRILENTKQLGNIKYKHVLRIYNHEADSLANNAVNRSVGQVKDIHNIYEKSIP